MDKKVSGLGSKWNHLLNRGATIAKEGLDFVNKQITDIRTNIGEPDDLNNLGDSDVVTTAMALGQVPVIYYLPPAHCPTQCSICPQHKRDELPHLFFLPADLNLSQLTVAKLKQFLPPSISSSSMHLRFKIAPPPEDQDIFSDYIWLDPEEDQTIPLFKGAIHLSFLHLPDLKSPVQKSPNAGITSYPQLNHRIDNTFSQSNPSPVPKKVDLLNSNSHLKHTSSAPPSNVPQTPFDRSALVSNREARQEERLKDAMNAHAARRERELAKMEEKDTASEELKEQLDHWALRNDGTFKDLRALLSSLPDVLWEGHQWQSVSLSELVVMKSNDFKKLYRSALLLCHPDKHQTSTAQTQFRAQRIFQALNESFKSMTW